MPPGLWHENQRNMKKKEKLKHFSFMTFLGIRRQLGVGVEV